MIGRFIGGTHDGQRLPVLTRPNGEPPTRWDLPLPPPDFLLVDHALEDLLGRPTREVYTLDGWYVRFSSGSRIPIYLFDGVSP